MADERRHRRQHQRQGCRGRRALHPGGFLIQDDRPGRLCPAQADRLQAHPPRPGKPRQGLDPAGGRWRVHRGAADLRAQDRRAEDRAVPLPHGRLAGHEPWIVAPPRAHPQQRRRVQRVQPQAGPSALRRRLRCQRALPGEPRRAEGMVRRSRRAMRPGEMALVGQRDRRQAGRARAGGVQGEEAIR